MTKRSQLILTTFCILFTTCALMITFVNRAAAQSDTATYTVTFNALWSDATHPSDAFPAGAHFSGLIGAVHNETVSFWETGSVASAGIELMAETGSKRDLTDEVNAAIAAGTAMALISESGTRSPDTLTFTIDVDATHPLATIVTMIAPSPDWFIGVSGLSLRSGDTWTPSLTVDLFPYDAGTDDGNDYTSTNAETDPKGAIERLTSVAPFSAESIGTLTFELSSTPTTVTLHNGTAGSVNPALLLILIAFVGLLPAATHIRRL